MPESLPDSDKGASSAVRRGIRWDAAAAIIASLVGLLALVVAGYTAYIERQQVRAQVWPYLQMTVDNAQPPYGLDAINKGVGPVIVRSVRVSVENKPVESWTALYQVLGFKPADGYVPSALSENVLQPGERLHWVVFRNVNDMNTFWDDFTRLHAEVNICYSSTLGDNWMLAFPSGTGRPRPISKCENVPLSEQFSG